MYSILKCDGDLQKKNNVAFRVVRVMLRYIVRKYHSQNTCTHILAKIVQNKSTKRINLQTAKAPAAAAATVKLYSESGMMCMESIILLA